MMRVEMPDGRTALARLREGNRRFVENVRKGSVTITISVEELAAPQRPMAIIVGCADSRVPAELIFDQGLGQLFMVRVAGNIVAPSQVGSVEFAAELFGTRLVVVLGHARCGAVLATLDHLLNNSYADSRNMMSIVDRIIPSVRPLFDTELVKDREALHHAGVRANVRASANQLRHGSTTLEKLVSDSGLLVVGAEYDMRDGEVEFFDLPPGI